MRTLCTSAAIMSKYMNAVKIREQQTYRAVLRGWVCVFYLSQCLHLGSVHIQLFCHTAVLQTKLNQLVPQRSHYLIETHLGTRHK